MGAKVFFLAVLCISQSSCLYADIQSESVLYRDGEAPLEGFIAYDDSTDQKRPGILVVHEWKGPGAYTEGRAKQLAEMGYLAFAVDMYGQGVRPKTHEEAGKAAGVYKNDRSLMRRRVKAGLEVLRMHPLVDSAKIAAIGYCFGGTTVLELARSGEPIKGVVSFHGALSTPRPEDAGNIKAKVLVLHGADDPFIVAQEIEAFRREMTSAGVDWRMEAYPGAVHSFTVMEAGNDPSKGAAYNKEADERSWEEMKIFFNRIFA